MLKKYEEMRKIDVRPFCEEREGKIYLNWAKCIDLLHENGAEKVYWTECLWQFLPGKMGRLLIIIAREGVCWLHSGMRRIKKIWKK